jgi:hypothetical protein
MLAHDHAGDNGNGGSDPPPIRQLLRPRPVDDAERAAMADGEYFRVALIQQESAVCEISRGAASSPKTRRTARQPAPPIPTTTGGLRR